MRILLVEDDESLGDGVRVGLAQERFTVDWVKDGKEALAALESENYGLMILDLGLPRLSGIDLLKLIRSRGMTIPVIILTARDTVADRILGLDCGADDYVVKPFDLDELAARIRALTRRKMGRAEPLLVHGNIVLDPAAHKVTLDGEEVSLSPREFAVLRELMENTGIVLSRDRLEQSLYGWNEEVESNALEVHIHHLRRKLGVKLIRTIRGVGYVIQKE
ncbi:MAG TPA: response regulator [Burkholderiales bacterium]|nr:response regulator [Burkholderiales bacterium]